MSLPNNSQVSLVELEEGTLPGTKNFYLRREDGSTFLLTNAYPVAALGDVTFVNSTFQLTCSIAYDEMVIL